MVRGSRQLCLLSSRCPLRCGKRVSQGLLRAAAHEVSAARSEPKSEHMVSFLHAADLHLGLRITRFRTDIAKKVREARFQALERIRDAALERKVDFVLIAGDLFDDHAVDGEIAKRSFDLLESFPAPVYVLSGNHDPLLAGAIWDRSPWNTPKPRRLRVLREAAPVEAMAGVVLFPCPVFRKTSTADPTAWIAAV